MIEDDRNRKDESSGGSAKQCTCYCLIRWIAALPNPDVSSPGFPNISRNWLGLTDTETDQGEVFWTADVAQKDYDCTTKVVSAQQTHSGVGLAKEVYTQSRTRPLTVGVAWYYIIPYWTITPGAWGAWARTTVANSEKAALGTASPAFLPWCSDEGVACP